MTERELLNIAITARQSAIAKYSNFKVGAALLCEDEQVYTGINIENSSYPATICAERVAFSKALSEGKRKFTAIAVVGGADTLENECLPCGVCRQFMSEFADEDFKVILGNEDSTKVYAFSELFPNAFSL